MINIICCGIIIKEVKSILKEIGFNENVTFFDSGLHDFERLERGLIELIIKKKEINNKPIVVIIGQTCHPDMNSMLNQHSVIGVNVANCFEALLGSKKKRLDEESKNYYITSGWLENWEEIMKYTGWTEVDARMNIGFCDRVILIDTGLSKITDEDILKLFDFIQIPIEIIKTNLDNLKKLIIEAIDSANELESISND